MLLKAKDMAYLSIMAAFSVILALLGNLIEINTIFFIAAAAFLVGVAIREHGLVPGFIFLAVCAGIMFLVLPNKLYVITYASFGGYIFGSEWIFKKIINSNPEKNKPILFWLLRLLWFNIMFIPVIIFFPEMLLGRKLEGIMLVLGIGAGQIAFIIFELAYQWFQMYIWRKLRNRLYHQ